jgi:hypothetical protein
MTFNSKCLVACAALLHAGCGGYPMIAQKPPPSAYYIPRSVPYPHEISVISDPPGARIEVNNDYVGVAPITVKVPQDREYFGENTTIKAIPTEPGDFVQTKVFLGNVSGISYGDKVPSRILFDMHLGPPTPSAKVSVDGMQ